MSIEPFAGYPDPNGNDPLAINNDPNEFAQASVATLMSHLSAIASTNYEFLPLLVQSGILSVIEHRFMTDDDFIYFPEDPERSAVLIAKDLRRNEMAARDKRPLIVVKFGRAQAETHAMRDAVKMAGADAPQDDRRAVRETLIYQIQVLDRDSLRATLLAQRIRGALIASRLDIQQAFNLQYVGYPDLNGPVLTEEYDDLFECTLNLQVLTIPAFRVRQDPLVIKKILLLIRANAARIIQRINVPGADDA
jgi:hypothetical protein